MAVMVETPPPMLIVQGPNPDFEELCRILEKIDADLPDGYRTEIIGGNVVVSPWSQCSYDYILDSVIEQLSPHVPEGYRARGYPRLFRFPSQSKAYGPDFYVIDWAALKTKGIYAPGDALSLVGEVTSRATAHADRQEKVEVYGKAGVPVYVLVDVLEGSVTVYSDPSPDRGYRAHTQVKISDKVHVPAPFGCELDTSGWEA
ncbi:Uma2 family endonuclease [Streptomyces sp. AV19]|uniref:Uma2 family endonuclease n=1 Tax=Streptomyces sp. AV19 TaxID=2793068 RepID=UPI0018FE705A|nr:Uma2 family endonuclease [Streptomyces sp. AV19]MBH1933184.1 Uma2 family endonuclease [Streptomyces sp. AV19]MDG4531901.1 Uma2 family endonuclease [Streptomyces sp. AV19]